MTKPTKDKTSSRRRFLKVAAAGAAATVAAPSIVERAGPDQHALAEHLAVQGHLPRIRPRLRQEGQRHDRRRSQDRGAAGRRRGSRLRPARCGVQGHARRRPWRAGLSLRQADRAGAVGFGPGLCHGRQHAAAWHKYGGGKELLAKLYASIGANVVSFPYGPMPTQPLGWFKKPITKAEDLKGLKFRTVGISIDVFTAWAPRSTRCRAAKSSRRWIAACSMRPSSTTPRRTASSASPTSPRSACCRATTRTPSSSRSCSTRPSTTRCRKRCGRSSRTPSRRPRPDMSWKAIDRYSKDYDRAADQGQGQVLQDAGRDPASSSSRSTTRSSRRSRRKTRCSRKSCNRSWPSPSGRRSGSRTPW